jgi:Family of unknown function (DUF6496)
VPIGPDACTGKICGNVAQVASTVQETPMAKYGPKASEKVERAVHEMKEGTLKTGSGKKVTSRKQAVAIGLSEARDAGGKVPKKRSSPSH